MHKIRSMESSDPEHYMEDVPGCISEVVRRFVQIAEVQLGGSDYPENKERLAELVSEGWVLGRGQVWGASNCLPDSLLQLLIFRGVLDTSY